MHPPAGKLKVNVDRSWDCSSKRGGVEIIVRNCQGVFVVARLARFDDVHSPAYIEALAAREGVSLCVESGYQNSILDNDALQIVMALCKSLINRSIIGPIIKDPKVLLSTITGGFSAHVRLQANGMSHRLVKFGPHYWTLQSWFEESLDLMFDLLVLECNGC